MTLLGNKNTYIEEESQEYYTLPAVAKEKNSTGISFEKSVLISTILHPTAFGALWIAFFILALLGINLKIFDKPDFKKDI